MLQGQVAASQSVSLSEPQLVFFSSKSRNTARFVERVGFPATRVPMSTREDMPVMNAPFVLVCPTYAGDVGEGAVPKQVIQFLNNPQNRSLMQGVIASGNRNFGKYYAYAGTVISRKCKVPHLYSFELMGTPEDVENVRNGVQTLWQNLPAKP